MAAGSTSVRTATPGGPLLGVARPRHGERVIKALLFASAMVSVLTTIGIVASLLGETIRFFGEVSIVDFFTGGEWSPLFSDPQFGIRPLVIGTLTITAIALVVAGPLGLGCAIYLSEYAKPRVRKVLKPVLEILAGVPTVVFGFFALTFFTPNVLKGFLGLDVGAFNALSAGIVVGLLVLPTIASVAEDAMSAVPAALREGSYGLGASKRQTSTRVVFPAALSGIVAAIVLGASRAIGETVIVLVAGGAIATNKIDPTRSMETMTAFIAATGKGDIATGSTAYKTIFAVGMTLFVLTLLINVFAIRFVRRFRQIYE
jgi:phosphate transport system permease protein